MKRKLLAAGVLAAGVVLAQDPPPPIEWSVYALQDRYMTIGPNGLEFPSVGIIFSVKCLGVPQGGGNYDLRPCGEHQAYRVILFYQLADGVEQITTGVFERNTSWGNSWCRFNLGPEAKVTRAIMQPLRFQQSIDFIADGPPSQQRMAVRK